MKSICNVDYFFRRNEEKINLNTEYFIKKGEPIMTSTTEISTTLAKTKPTQRRRRRLTTLSPRIPILVKKLGKRPILKPATDRIDNLIKKPPLEVTTVKTENITYKQNVNHAMYPMSWAPLLEVLRGEVWDVPILVASGFLACILIIFEVSLLARTFRHKYASSRRHLFLGQVHLFKVVKVAINQILREINFEEFRSAKSAIQTLSTVQ